MIGLADCNNFFVSCERVFRPSLIGRPVIVLSNNDGCAVALSNEAKTLGIKRGDPYFKIREQAERGGAVVFSGNHRLYGDMSRRVMTTLRSFCADIEIYSIDEAFLFLDDEIGDIGEFGRHIVKTVRRNTGIPISLGLAHTKTLAKIAARFAKQYDGYQGACLIDTPEKARKAMSLTAIENVWGIGRRNAPKLRRQGITTALELADMSEDRVKELFNIVGHRMWRELNGHSCISKEIVPPQRKSISCARSFQSDLYDIDEVKKSIVSHATTCANRLRSQGLVAEAIEVYVCTNRFHESLPQYFNAATQRLSDPTDDTSAIVGSALRALEKVYRSGYGYKKTGVTITHCTAKSDVTRSLFANPEEIARRERLMRAMDHINASPQNRHAVHIASMNDGGTDMTRREHESRLFSTRLSDIIEIK
ncbi:MAG: Y-family DNA polymerase [Bacteroidales bacterium]|nr:Y-family DNA polymerase [Bacteroidales bacterium]